MSALQDLVVSYREISQTEREKGAHLNSTSHIHKLFNLQV